MVSDAVLPTGYFRLKCAAERIASRPYFVYNAIRCSSFSFSSLNGEPGISCIKINKTSKIAKSVKSDVKLIQTRLPISIRIGGCAVGLGAVVGLILGLIAALKHDTIWDSLATFTVCLLMLFLHYYNKALE